MKNIPDTTSSMYTDNRYKEFTREELIELSKKHDWEWSAKKFRRLRSILVDIQSNLNL